MIQNADYILKKAYLLIIGLLCVYFAYADLPIVKITTPVRTDICYLGINNNFTGNITAPHFFYSNGTEVSGGSGSSTPLTTTCAFGYVMQNISSDVAQCVPASAGGWVGTATSNLNMMGKNISNVTGLTFDGDGLGIPSSYLHFQDSSYPINLFDLRYVNLPPDGGTNGMVFNTYGQRYVWVGDGTKDLNIYNYSSVTINGSKIITAADNPLTSPMNNDLVMTIYKINFTDGFYMNQYGIDLDGAVIIDINRLGVNSQNDVNAADAIFDGDGNHHPTIQVYGDTGEDRIQVFNDADTKKFFVDSEGRLGFDDVDLTAVTNAPSNIYVDNSIYMSGGGNIYDNQGSAQPVLSAGTGSNRALKDDSGNTALTFASATAPQFNGMTTNGVLTTTNSDGTLISTTSITDLWTLLSVSYDNYGYVDGVNTEIDWDYGIVASVNTAYDDSLLTNITYLGSEYHKVLTPITAQWNAEGLKQYRNNTGKNNTLTIYKPSDVEKFYPECIVRENLSQWNYNKTTNKMEKTTGREVKTYNRNCVTNRIQGELKQLDSVMELSDSQTLRINTSVEANNYYTLSKVVNDSKDYTVIFANNTKFTDKTKSDAYDTIVNQRTGEVIGRLSVEKRIVYLEGYVTNEMDCIEKYTKYEDYRNCMLGILPKK